MSNPVNVDPATLPPDTPGHAGRLADERRRIASDRRRVGVLLAQMWSPSIIAERMGVSATTIERWRDTDPECMTAYAEENGRLNRTAEFMRTQLYIEAPGVLEHALTVAKDTAHRDFGAMARFLIDKVLIPQSIQHNKNEYHIDLSFWKAMDERLTRYLEPAREARPARDIEAAATLPELLVGKAAADSYGVSSLREPTRILDSTDVPIAESNGGGPGER